MANRVPLVVANQKMREIADGDTLDLTGNPLIVGGDLTPSADSAYDLGSSSKKWKDLHLSGSTIHLGNILLQDSGGKFVTRDSASGPVTSFQLSNNTTDDVAEGSSNLYHTTARARNAINVVDAGGDGSFAYDSSLGKLTYTGPSASEVRAHFSGGSGIGISSGTISLDSDLTVTGNLIVTQNLTVQGTETIINSTTLSINDKTIILADSAADSAAASGAGIEVYAAGASITYDHSNVEWDINRKINVRGTTIDDGGIAIKTTTGSVAYVDLFCESGNSHRVRVKSPGHSDYSGNIDVILPNENGTIATVGNDSADRLLIKDSSGSTIKTIQGVGNSAL